VVIPRKRLVTFALAFAAGIGGVMLLAAKLPQAPTPPQAPRPPQDAPAEQTVWTEAAWPFPVDQWGEGWAYRCKAADCGIDVDLYLRPKLGFCNCQTGVADDPELERVGDLDLVGTERSALGPGRPIAVQWMKGRSRAYAVGAQSATRVLSLAFNDRCDVIVATAVARDDLVAREQSVLAFLNGDLMRHWAETMLGR
jgi:hypothetical protein